MEPGERRTTPMEIYQKSQEEVLKELQSDAASGLTAAEAARRLEQYGPNSLQEKRASPGWKNCSTSSRMSWS